MNIYFISIAQTIIIIVRITGITLGITIGIGLCRIRIKRTVIAGITDTV